ncbi:MAG: DUF3105 domain-containing protein [Myxococcales bacterium]
MRALVLAGFALASGCGRVPLAFDGGPWPVWDGGDDAGVCPPGVVGQFPDASYNHVLLGTIVDYGSNPPAGGDHYPYWAIWGIHTDVVPPEYFVHNEEHGGVVLLYNCPEGCPDIVATLTELMNAQPADPLCTEQDTGVTNRMLMTPDPDILGPVAAASWGWYYNEASPCVDVVSLQAFITAHYGQGREPLCGQGYFP